MYKIYVEWNKIIPRHKLFFSMSFYFFFAIFLILLGNFYQSYDENGAKILLITFLSNLYIYLL